MGIEFTGMGSPTVSFRGKPIGTLTAMTTSHVATDPVDGRQHLFIEHIEFEPAEKESDSKEDR